MNKQFIFEKFIEIHNEHQKSKIQLRKDSLALCEIHKVNLNEVLMAVKSFANSKEYYYIFSFDLRNKTIKFLNHKNISYLNEKNEYNYLSIVLDKKEDYFYVVDFKEEKHWKINNKPSENLISQNSFKRTFDKENGIIELKQYDYNLSEYVKVELINLNKNSLMRFSSTNDKIKIDNAKAYDLHFNEIFSIDSNNKKINFLDLSLEFREFKIVKNEYFLDNIIIKETDKEKLVTVYFRTKKNTKKNISFYYNTETKEFINLTVYKIENYDERKDPHYYNSFDGKLYYLDIEKTNSKRKFFEFNKTFNYDNSKHVEIKFDKKGIEFLKSCLNDICKEIKFFEDFKVKNGSNNLTMIFSKNKKILCIYDKKLKKLMHFNFDKIFEKLKHIDFEASSRWDLFNNNDTKGDTKLILDSFNMTNKTLYFKTENHIYLGRDRGYNNFEKLEQIYYYFDMKSNFIVEVFKNEDKNSLFNNSNLVIKHIFKKDKRMILINNLRVKMSLGSLRNKYLNQ